ncbi:MAG: 3'-5' exonuclease [Rhodoferax sp.]|nr:3'-5' exonuclease [Rhodoferax sp.]
MNLLQALSQRLRGALAPDDRRWVVLDVESSGLDPKADRLLAIAAIAVHTDGKRAQIALGDSFEVVLRQQVAVADKANILLHGIGVGAQRDGVEPALALGAFGQFIGRSPLIAFHAAFDQTLILRAFDAVQLRRPDNPWLDLEPLAAVLHPEVRAHALDEWMAALQITCTVRHQAAADTLATAELLLKLWPVALRDLGGVVHFAAARRLAGQRRWMPHG